ncbi:MAG TPA: GtrA family protein [Mesorhizobium sp.]|jgi:putative flippase GtrA|nr:GtrA family protein [Mesorhizobium sp.]
MAAIDSAFSEPRLGESRRFAGFLLVGGMAASINVASCAALSTALPYESAIVLAYLTGMTTAFMLAKLFVFGDSGRSTGQEYARFALVNAVALAQVWLVSVALAQHLFPTLGYAWNPEITAHAIGVLSPALTSYWGHRRFTFRAA